MAEIKEFKPKAAEPVVDEDMLKSAQALVERVKTGQIVGLAIAMVERGTMNALHSWGGDCPRSCIIGSMAMLQNRIMGNLQEAWAEPFDGDGPQAKDMPGSSIIREATMNDLPDGDNE